MLDYSSNFSETLNQLIDDTIIKENDNQQPRDYLGASRLGVSCKRALQYEYLNTPKDENKTFNGKTLRIFEAGHVFEDLAIKWLHNAGIELRTTKSTGWQFGFSVANGRIKGHVDGIIISAPEELGIRTPALWEMKSLNSKSWKDTVKKGLAISKPIYAAQIATYQAYMEASVKGISKNPALFTAINKDTAELYHELVPFDVELAQRMSDRAVAILKACDAGETLPRISKDPTYFECKMCAYRNTCFAGSGDVK